MRLRGVVTDIVLRFYPSYYGREGNEKNRVEKRERGERESIVCIATNKSKGNEKDNNTRVKKVVLYSNSSQ